PRPDGCLLCDGYLLPDFVPDATDLRAPLYARARLSAAEGRPRLRACVERLARLVRMLHDRQLSHRDLKAANVLVRGDELWLIDLVGLRVFRRLSRGRRVQNLARLNASFCRSGLLTRTDRLRFLRMYLEWGLSGRAGWKTWWREVAQATEAKTERNRRNGRPLA